MEKVGNFDICRVMSQRGMDIRLSLLDNITNMRVVHRGQDTNITIGFPGNIIAGIMEGEYVGGLLLCNKKQYFEVKAELEKNA